MLGHVVSLASLFAICVATSIVPGPNNFLLMRLGMSRGRKAAMAAGFGTTLGCIIWCVAAALGLAALLSAAPWLYRILRVGGGLYLVWFAFALWRAKPQPEAETQAAGGGAASAFWQGLAVCLTNPKSVLFFASIFSAYVGPDTPLWAHVAAVVIVVTTCQLWQTTMAWCFSTRRAIAAYGRAQRPLDRTAALLMGGFGASLIFALE